jgi:antitoxin HigA-1
MPRTPIHPGEHLADELQELRMSARELARDQGADHPGNRHPARPPWNHRRYSLAAWPVFWSEPRFLDEPAKAVRARYARQEIGEQLAEILCRPSNEAPRPTLPK